MVRVVRTREGDVEVDAIRRAPGRGAWLHPDPRCVEAALARGGLAKAMRAGVGPETAGRLRAMSTEEQEHA